MRKVRYQYEKMSGARPVGWEWADGWFHTLVVVREDRTDEVYAIIETKQGKLTKIPYYHITFTGTPLTSDS